MTLLERLQIAYQSQIGTLLLGLLFFLALLGFCYWLLLLRQKKKDIYAYLFRAHYENAQLLAKELIVIGGYKSDFFGRQNVIQLPNGKRGIFLVPPPDLSSEEIRDKFRCFSRAIENLRLPLLAPYIWKQDRDNLSLVQGNLFQPDGRALLSMKHYLFDKKITDTDKEKILFNIARSLATLHDVQAEIGGFFYHGFLLPRSIFLDFDVTYNVRRIVLADTGLVFALGPERLHQRLNQLREGKLPIEKFYAHDLLEQISMLAPEQKNPHQFDQVGPAADFFSYAALAIAMLTKRRFIHPQMVNWNDVPQRWRHFLKASLEEDPLKRPKDFMELEDWLNDPELALTNQMNEIKQESIEVDFSENQNVSFSEMKQRIKNINPQPSQAATLSSVETDHLSKLLEAGVKAINTSKWEAAYKSYQEALNLSPDNPEIQAKLAIVCYECGDLKNAEFFYQKTKQSHPRLARAFREHIAFKV